MIQATAPPLKVVRPPAHVLVLGELTGIIPTNLQLKLSSPSTGSIIVCQMAEEPLSTERAIKEIKSISGLPWDQVAGIFRRKVRTAHLWAEGQGTDADTEASIRRVHALLWRVGQISPLLNRRFLLTVVREGKTVLDLLRDKEFKEVELSIADHLASTRPANHFRTETLPFDLSHPYPVVLMTANPNLGSSLSERVVRSTAKRLPGV